MLLNNMVTEYEVIKPFDSLKKGDKLVYNNGVYEFESHRSGDNFSSYTRVAMNKNVVDEYAKAGLLQSTDHSSNKEDKLNKISTLITQLKNTYNQRKNSIEKKYNDGKIQTCVKVEHDTVYFNLMKLLNKIEDIINE